MDKSRSIWKQECIFPCLRNYEEKYNGKILCNTPKLYI